MDKAPSKKKHFSSEIVLIFSHLLVYIKFLIFPMKTKECKM